MNSVRAATRSKPSLSQPNAPTSLKPGPYAHRQLDDIAARWDARATAWDRELLDPACHLNEDEGYARFLTQARRIITQRRAFCSQHGVIDAGCGTGLVLAEFNSQFAWGVGVDISRQMIRIARRKQIARIRFIHGDCFRLPEICSGAGAILSRGVLLSHYGKQQGELLLRAARAALIPRGFLLFDFLNAPGRINYAHKTENKTWLMDKEVLAMALHAGFLKARILGEVQRRVRLLLAQ